MECVCTVLKAVVQSSSTVHCGYKQEWDYGTDPCYLLVSRCFKNLTFEAVLTSANKIEQLLIKT